MVFVPHRLASSLKCQIFTIPSNLLLCYFCLGTRFSESWDRGCQVKILSEAIKQSKVNKHGLLCHLHADGIHISNLGLFPEILPAPFGNLIPNWSRQDISKLNRTINYSLSNIFPYPSLPHLSNGTTIYLVSLGALFDSFLSLISPHLGFQ